MSEDPFPLLTPERIKIIKKSDSKKRVIEMLSELLASEQKNTDYNTVNQHDIFDALIAREKIGNTLLTNGIALPRAQLNINKPRVALVYLKKGIRLDAPDKKPSKLFLALLFPRHNSDNERTNQNKNQQDNSDNEHIIDNKHNNESAIYKNMIKHLIRELSSQTIIDDFKVSDNPQILLNYFNKLLQQTPPEKQSNHQLSETA